MGLIELKVNKVTDSNHYYNIFVGENDTMLEVLKSSFKGLKRPRAGDTIKILQQNIEGKSVTSMTLNGQQFL